MYVIPSGKFSKMEMGIDDKSFTLEKSLYYNEKLKAVQKIRDDESYRKKSDVLSMRATAQMKHTSTGDLSQVHHSKRVFKFLPPTKRSHSAPRSANKTTNSRLEKDLASLQAKQPTTIDPQYLESSEVLVLSTHHFHHFHDEILSEKNGVLVVRKGSTLRVIVSSIQTQLGVQSDFDLTIAPQLPSNNCQRYNNLLSNLTIHASIKPKLEMNCTLIIYTYAKPLSPNPHSDNISDTTNLTQNSYEWRFIHNENLKAINELNISNVNYQNDYNNDFYTQTNCEYSENDFTNHYQRHNNRHQNNHLSGNQRIMMDQLMQDSNISDIASYPVSRTVQREHTSTRYTTQDVVTRAYTLSSLYVDDDMLQMETKPIEEYYNDNSSQSRSASSNRNGSSPPPRHRPSSRNPTTANMKKNRDCEHNIHVTPSESHASITPRNISADASQKNTPLQEGNSPQIHHYYNYNDRNNSEEVNSMVQGQGSNKEEERYIQSGQKNAKLKSPKPRIPLSRLLHSNASLRYAGNNNVDVDDYSRPSAVSTVSAAIPRTVNENNNKNDKYNSNNNDNNTNNNNSTVFLRYKFRQESGDRNLVDHLKGLHVRMLSEESETGNEHKQEHKDAQRQPVIIQDYFSLPLSVPSTPLVNVSEAPWQTNSSRNRRTKSNSTFPVYAGLPQRKSKEGI